MEILWLTWRGMWAGEIDLLGKASNGGEGNNKKGFKFERKINMQRLTWLDYDNTKKEKITK